jgi:hypothetical protein
MRPGWLIPAWKEGLRRASQGVDITYCLMASYGSVWYMALGSTAVTQVNALVTTIAGLPSGNWRRA